MSNWLKKQVDEVDDFFQKRSLILVASIILTVFLSKIEFEPSNNFGKFNIGISYLLVVFLFCLILYQMYRKICEVELKFSFKSMLDFFKNINYIMFLLFVMMFMFLISFGFEFAVKYSQVIGLAIGMTIGSVLGLAMYVVSFGVPVVITRSILQYAREEKNKTKQRVWQLMGWLLMGVAIPLIAYLMRKNPFDTLILPVYVFSICGWILLINMFWPINKKKK